MNAKTLFDTLGRALQERGEERLLDGKTGYSVNEMLYLEVEEEPQIFFNMMATDVVTFNDGRTYIADGDELMELEGLEEKVNEYLTWRLSILQDFNM